MNRLTIEYTEVVCDGWLPPAAGGPPRGPVRLAIAWTALHHAECLKPHDYDDIGYMVDWLQCIRQSDEGRMT